MEKNKKECIYCCYSVAQVVSDSLWPHRLQYTRLPCLYCLPGVCSSSDPLSQWCHPTISSSVAPFSSCPQSFWASGSFPMNWLFTSGGQSAGVSALASVLLSASLVAQTIKNLPAMQGLVTGLGRSPGKGNGNPLQYSCLENPHEQRNLEDAVHGVAKSWTWLSN